MVSEFSRGMVVLEGTNNWNQSSPIFKWEKTSARSPHYMLLQDITHTSLAKSLKISQGKDSHLLNT